MPARKLARNVHVAATPTGPPRFFEAGSSPEKEYAEQITNPKAWGEDEEEAPAARASTTGATKSAAAAKKP